MVMDLTGNRNQDNISNAIQMIRSRIIAKRQLNHCGQDIKIILIYLIPIHFIQEEEELENILENYLVLEKLKPRKRVFHTEQYSDEIGSLYANKIENQLRVEHVNNTDIIKISYGSVWAAEAQLITNTLTEVYKKFEKEINAEEAINAVRFIEDLVKEQVDLLSDAEKKSCRFSKPRTNI